MAYIPLDFNPSNKLPIEEGDELTLNLTHLGIPATATEVLVYFFVSIRDSSLSQTHRHFYEFSTSDGPVKYCKYMNAIFTKDDYVMNSENIWFPVSGTDKTLTVKMLCAGPWPEEIRIKNCHETKSNVRQHQGSHGRFYKEHF